MDDYEKMAKLIKTLSLCLGAALVLIGAVSAFKGDPLRLGEDGLLGVAVGLLGYGIGQNLAKKGKGEEEEPHDEGI